MIGKLKRAAASRRWDMSTSPKVPTASSAVAVDDAKTMRYVLRQSDDETNVKDLLFVAARSDAVNCVQALLEDGLDINQRRTKSIVTPLIQAAYYGAARVVALLVNRGADTTLRNKWGETAMDCAVKKSRMHVIDALR